MIVSTVAGRIRVRSKRLKSAKIAKTAEREARAIVGVNEARSNASAGSLVVSYDTRLIDTIELEDRLEALCMPPAYGGAGARRTVSRYLNQATKIGMVTTLATSVAYGVAGNKKMHIGFGTAFLALAGMHMLRYQATLLR